MITIIHGDDTGSSRKYLNELKERVDTAISLEGDKISVTDLAQELTGGGLFVEKRTLIIEGLLSKKKIGKEKDALIAYLKEHTLEHDILLWEGKDLDKRALKHFTHATQKQFKTPQVLFLFLDSIKPNNGMRLTKLFHQALTTTEVEIMFFMLIRQFRFLLAFSEKSSEQIDEIKRLQPWQQEKLKKQAKLFNPNILIAHYLALSEIDKKQKTGNLPHTLTSAIDIFLLDI